MRRAVLLVCLWGLASVEGLPSHLWAAAPPLAKREVITLKHPASGHVREGRLYTMRVYKQSVFTPPGVLPVGFAPPDVVCIPVTAKDGPEERFALDSRHVEDDTWFRWRISRGLLWCTGGRPRAASGLSRIRLDILLRNELSVRNAGSGFRQWPVGQIAETHGGSEKGLRDVLAAPWDGLPGRGNTAYCFLAWQGELFLWHGRPKPSEGKREYDDPEIWDGPGGIARKGMRHAPIIAIKADLKEQFQAHTDGKDFFLVTASGAVHRLTQRGKEWKLEPSWRGAARPVRLLVTDDATGRTFAFAHRAGPLTEELPDIYFPLAGKMTPAAYKRDEASPAKASDSEAALLAGARLLIKKGEIKGKR